MMTRDEMVTAVLAHEGQIRGMVARTVKAFASSLPADFASDVASGFIVAVLGGKADGYDGAKGARIGTYLCAMARNYALDALRHSAHVESVPYDTRETGKVDEDGQDWRIASTRDGAGGAVKPSEGVAVASMVDAEMEEVVERIAEIMGDEWSTLMAITDNPGAWASENGKTIGYARVLKHRLLEKAREIRRMLTGEDED